MIYLDNAATTQPRETVVEAIQPYHDTYYRNPSAAYAEQEATAIGDARQAVATLLNTTPDTIVFTGGRSETNNLALRGTIDPARNQHIVTTTIEHPAILETCQWLETQGTEVTYIAPDHDGRVDPNAIQDAIRPETTLVSVMHANNETGVIQPLDAIGQITDEHDVLFHSDTVQSAGKIPIDVDDLGLDLASLSAHKYYGPKGVGSLYVRDGVELGPLIHGGGQERGLRSGTENVLGITGMGCAAALATDDLVKRRERLPDLRDELISALQTRTEVALVGHPDRRLPGYALLVFPGFSGANLVKAFAAHDIAVSSGSACHSGEQSPSRVRMEMDVDTNLALSAVRFSLGRETTASDIQYVKDHLGQVLEAART